MDPGSNAPLTRPEQRVICSVLRDTTKKLTGKQSMAKRYVGDVEIRLMHMGNGVYRASVRWPGHRGKGEVKLHSLRRDWQSPESYDRAAEKILREAMAAAKAIGFRLPIGGTERSPDIRRTFQSPCPYRS